MDIDCAINICRHTGENGGELMAFAQQPVNPKTKARQKYKWNAEHCPCKKKNCQRYKNCDTCKAHHETKKTLPYCER